MLDTEKYISSKRASEITGYAQDYIGQLARGSFIEARRIGGLWYISMDSLLAYKNKSDDFKPKQPPHNDNSFPDADAFVHLDGKEYISASRASKLTGYNQDYVGQLARGGKIISRQIGNRWYVDKDALLAHKEEKDALLAAVQVEAVGIKDKPGLESRPESLLASEPLLKYLIDEGDLLPSLDEKRSSSFNKIGSFDSHSVPIRKVVEVRDIHRSFSGTTESLKMQTKIASNSSGRISRRTIHKAIIPVFALTIIVVLSFGLVSLKKDSIYTMMSGFPSSLLATNRLTDSSLLANASYGFDALMSFLENSLTTELVYQRTQ